MTENPLGLPTHMLDQLNAATRDNMLDALTFAASRPGARVVVGDTFGDVIKAKTPEGKLMRRMVLSLQRKENDSCGHLANPAPCCMLAWETPFKLRCWACQDEIQPDESDDNWRCDYCGRVDREKGETRSIAKGPITFIYFLCSPCIEAK